jgi:prepilin-type processing-associated H-X9-DG protein
MYAGDQGERFFGLDFTQGVWWWWSDVNNPSPCTYVPSPTCLCHYLNVKGLGGILFCATARDEPLPLFWMYNHLSYAYNYHLASGTKIGTVSRPQDKLMFIDAVVYGMDQYDNVANWSGRHSGRSNIVYVDGHAGTISLSEFSVSNNLGTYLNP